MIAKFHPSWNADVRAIWRNSQPRVLARRHSDPSLVHPPPQWLSLGSGNLLYCSQTAGLILCRMLAGGSYIMYLLSAQARNHYVHGSLLTSWHLSPPFKAVKSCFICKCHHVIYSWKGSHSQNSMLQFKRGAWLYSQWVILKQTLLLINAFLLEFLGLKWHP